MPISGIIQFHSSSGAPCGSLQFDTLVANSGQMYNRIGHFGISGPNSFVSTNTYQDTTYIVNEDGAVSGAYPASGKLSNLKYVNSASVNPNSSGSQAVSGISRNDATIRIHFTQPSGTPCTTQNAKFRCVALNASSGIDNIATLASGLYVQAFEVGVSSAWSLISQNGAQNYISIADRAGSSIVHDFFVGISASPISVGVLKSHGYLFSLEYI